MMMWLAKRWLWSAKGSLTRILGLVGLSFGVAALMVTMSVVSGFETSLKKSVIDVFGDLTAHQGWEGATNEKSLKNEIQALAVVDYVTPYLQTQASIVAGKKMAGVYIEAFPQEALEKGFDFKSKLVQGEMRLGGDSSKALIGVELARRFKLKVGDKFRLVVPKENPNSGQWSPKMARLQVGGLLDLGRYQMNERFILIDIKTSEKLFADSYSKGFKVLLKNSDEAVKVADALNAKEDRGYYLQSWRDVNSNLFNAVESEKVVIFFILGIMILASCFSVSSHLFISVMSRYADIALLKAIGMRSKDTLKLFLLQGLLVGVLGNILGLTLGLLLCFGFSYLQSYWGLLPGEAYTVTNLKVDVRLIDMLAIFVFSTLLCLLSSLAPAFLGARLRPVEGLRYE